MRALCHNAVFEKRHTAMLWAGSTVRPAGTNFTSTMEPACGEFELVHRTVAGDEAAFREIVERHQAMVFAVIHSIVGNCNDAEDIALEVFTKVYFSLRKFDCRAALGTWMHRIAVNASFDYLRRQKRMRDSVVTEADLRQDDERRLDHLPAARAHDFAGRLALREVVVRLLQTLNSEERNLLLMKELQGYCVGEMASLTGLNENTLKVKLLRARRKMAAAAARSGLHDLLRRAGAG